MFVAQDRLAVVGSYAQFAGSFGLQDFGQGSLVQGTVVMGTIVLVGMGFLIYRLHLGGRRGA